MYTFPKKEKKTRWVLLEHLPTILSPKILVLIFLYAMAFTLLLLGARILHFEHILTDVTDSLTSAMEQTPFNGVVIENSTDNSRQMEVLYQQETPKQIQENIASKVIRLHVIANSDTPEDQTLKLQVRDAVIKDLQNSLATVNSVEEARNIIHSRLSSIQETATRTVDAEGYSYPVKATLENRHFPVKTYGDLSFPAGDYEALCLEIGSGQGHNWWCVLFPSLCFVDETYAIVPEESKEKLKASLSKQEYDSLEIHSAIYDAITGKD